MPIEPREDSSAAVDDESASIDPDAGPVRPSESAEPSAPGKESQLGEHEAETPSLSPTQVPRYSSDEVLPSLTSDERDIGWGDHAGEYSDEWYESERPPHHG